jgi:hypothetical protein
VDQGSEEHKALEDTLEDRLGVPSTTSLGAEPVRQQGKKKDSNELLTAKNDCGDKVRHPATLSFSG